MTPVVVTADNLPSPELLKILRLRPLHDLNERKSFEHLPTGSSHSFEEEPYGTKEDGKLTRHLPYNGTQKDIVCKTSAHTSVKIKRTPVKKSLDEHRKVHKLFIRNEVHKLFEEGKNITVVGDTLRERFPRKPLPTRELLDI